MPNTGKPSKDCHLCRQRRVKCDLARPSCQRCIKYGTTCPGYRAEQETVFRHVLPANLKRGKARASRQEARTGSPASSQSQSPGFFTWDSNVESSQAGSSTGSNELVAQRSPSSAASSAPSPQTAVSLRGIKEDWTLHSVPLLMSCYSSVTVLGTIMRGLNFENNAFIHATHLWARTYLVNRYHAPQDPREAELCVGKALGSVALAMRNPQHAIADSTIMAVWLLGMYELQIGGIGNADHVMATWSVHADGLLSILRARGPGQFTHRSGRQIFWSAYTIIQIKSILTVKACPPESESWLGAIEAIGDLDDAMLLHVTRYVDGACGLLSQVIPWLTQGNYSAACANWATIISAVSDLEVQLQRWLATATRREIEPGGISNYFWNTWRCARLKLQHTIILLSNVVQYGPVPSPIDHGVLEERRQLSRALVAETARGILTTIPTMLGGTAEDYSTTTHGIWFEGMRMIWPLTNVYTMRTIPRQLRLTAKAALATIGDSIGIKQALKSRPGAVVYVPEATIGIPIDQTVEGATISEVTTPEKSWQGTS